MATTHSKHRATEVTPDKIVIDWDAAWASVTVSQEQKLAELKSQGWRTLAEAAKLFKVCPDRARKRMGSNPDIYEWMLTCNGKTTIKLWRPKT